MDIKDTYTKVILEAAGQRTDPKTVKQFRAVWWYNFRSKDSGGLRFTEHCLNFIENYAKIKTYKIEFPKDFSFTPQVLVWLDNYIESPYYITKRHIVVLREKAAFELYLFSGDVRKFGHAKALSKRLNQESTS